ELLLARADEVAQLPQMIGCQIGAVGGDDRLRNGLALPEEILAQRLILDKRLLFAAFVHQLVKDGHAVAEDVLARLTQSLDALGLVGPRLQSQPFGLIA